MTKQSYWNGTRRLPHFPKLESNIKVDVAVIGGGLTGITAAYLLKQAGKSVALLERDRFARADTGHTTAHLTYVTDARLQRLVKDFGRDHAQAVWDAGRAGMNKISDLIEAEAIDCDFSWIPGYLHQPVDQATTRSKSPRKTPTATELGLMEIREKATVGKPAVLANQAKFHLSSIWALSWKRYRAREVTFMKRARRKKSPIRHSPSK